jgi:putative FmdB family regulatory protein
VPTYQYVCTACDEPLEAVQAFSDPALTECPSCGGRLRKVFSSVGIVFKGSGFYRTDSREAAKAAANGEGGGGKDAKSPDSTSSDTKADTKSDAKTADQGTSKTAAGTARQKTPAPATTGS